MKEILTNYGFDGENTPAIYGSALFALKDTNPELGEKSIKKLIETLESD